MSNFQKLGLALLLTAPLAACREPTEPPSSDPPTFAPAGNANKVVSPIHIEFPEVCPDGTPLDVSIDGWIQTKVFTPNSKNIQLNVFHNTWTFTNPSDQTFVFREVGPDRLYMQDGKLFVAVVGRVPFGHIGRLVFDLSTDPPTQVFSAGRDFGDLLLLACEDLT